MLVKELMEIINVEANKLNGTKIENMNEIHNAFRRIFNQELSGISFLDFSTWRIKHSAMYELDPITYNVELLEDKRYKVERRGKIIKAYFELHYKDEVENLTLEQWDFYLCKQAGLKELQNVENWLNRIDEEKQQALNAKNEIIEKYKDYL